MITKDEYNELKAWLKTKEVKGRAGVFTSKKAALIHSLPPFTILGFYLQEDGGTISFLNGVESPTPYYHKEND